MKQIHSLTGLRGLAALLVFVEHAATESILPSYLGHGFGQAGLMLFFVLSGFLMAHLYIHEPFDRANLNRYVFARIGRIVPLYFLLLILSVIITQLVSPESFYPYKFYKVKHVVQALLMLEAKYVFWTIPVEVQFYALFVVFWALYQRGVSAYFLFAYAVLTLVPSVLIYLAGAGFPKIVSAYAYAFFIGVATALSLDKIRHSRWVARYLAPAGALSLGLLLVNFPEIRAAQGLVWGEHVYVQTWLDPITWGLVYVLFLAAALNLPGVSILSRRFLVAIGKVSYGFYLIHYPLVLFFVKEVSAPDPIKVLGAFLATWAIAHLSYYFFEKPVGARIRGFGQRRIRSPEAGPEARGGEGAPSPRSAGPSG